MRVGQPFPLASRNAALAADAILARDRSTRRSCRRSKASSTCGPPSCASGCAGAAITFVAPLRADAWDWTLERAIATARSSRGHLTFVGSEDGWTSRGGSSLRTRRRPGGHAPLHAPRDPHARRRARSRSTSSSAPCRCSPHWPSSAGASTPGGCSPGAGSPRTARASSGRATEPPPTSPARASPTRARCCSRPR